MRYTACQKQGVTSGSLWEETWEEFTAVKWLQQLTVGWDGMGWSTQLSVGGMRKAWPQCCVLTHCSVHLKQCLCQLLLIGGVPTMGATLSCEWAAQKSKGSTKCVKISHSNRKKMQVKWQLNVPLSSTDFFLNNTSKGMNQGWVIN